MRTSKRKLESSSSSIVEIPAKKNTRSTRSSWLPEEFELSTVKPSRKLKSNALPSTPTPLTEESGYRLIHHWEKDASTHRLESIALPLEMDEQVEVNGVIHHWEKDHSHRLSSVSVPIIQEQSIHTPSKRSQTPTHHNKTPKTPLQSDISEHITSKHGTIKKSSKLMNTNVDNSNTHEDESVITHSINTNEYYHMDRTEYTVTKVKKIIPYSNSTPLSTASTSTTATTIPSTTAALSSTDVNNTNTSSNITSIGVSSSKHDSSDSVNSSHFESNMDDISLLLLYMLGVICVLIFILLISLYTDTISNNISTSNLMQVRMPSIRANSVIHGILCSIYVSLYPSTNICASSISNYITNTHNTNTNTQYIYDYTYLHNTKDNVINMYNYINIQRSIIEESVLVHTQYTEYIKNKHDSNITTSKNNMNEDGVCVEYIQNITDIMNTMSYVNTTTTNTSDNANDFIYNIYVYHMLLHKLSTQCNQTKDIQVWNDLLQSVERILEPGIAWDVYINNANITI